MLRPGGLVAVMDKFVPADACPGPARRMLGVVTQLAATSISTRLSALVAGSPFAIVHDEPIMLRGQFRLALLERGSSPSETPPTPTS